MASVAASTRGATTRETRSKTGNSKPRTFSEIDVGSTTVAPAKRKKAGTTKAAGTTTKPRAKKTATGRVTKKEPASKKVKKAGAKVAEKVNGTVEKAEGAVEGKPGKKASGTAKLRGTKEPKPKATAGRTKKA